MSADVDHDDEVLDEASPDDWADAETIIGRIRQAELDDAAEYEREHADE